MSELSTQSVQLPANLEDLSKFVLVGRERLTAVRAELRAIQKVGLAKEVHEQKLAEAQEIAEAVLDAETKLGELTSKMKKSQGFASIHPNGGENAKTKTEQLSELGISHHERFETLASHPDKVEQAKAVAREEGRIVTRQDVFNIVAAEKETQRQQEERELREAKGRAEAYQAPSGKVADFGAVKQHQEDNTKILEEFKNELGKTYLSIIRLAEMAKKEITLNAIKAADQESLIEIDNKFHSCDRAICEALFTIEGAIDEK